MIRQDFSPHPNGTPQTPKERGHIWEVRHAGLLGIKYEVAVRSDLFDEIPLKGTLVKREDVDLGIDGQEILRGVVEAAILG
jgi:TATA-binding protein-associated factor